MLFWIGLEMIEFCYQDTIGDYLVPNGTPPLILKKMKEMDNPSEVFDNGGYQICEVNSSPGFEGMDKYCKTNIAEKIVTFVKYKLG